MIKTVMGALAAMLVSSVAFATVTEAKLNKEVAQLDSDHQQVLKTDSKAQTPKSQTDKGQIPTVTETNRPSSSAKATDKSAPFMRSFKEYSVAKGAHDAAKADANMADSSGSLGTGATQHTLKVEKGAHDAAKADASNADSSGSIGSGATTHTLKIAKSVHDAAKADASNADASGSDGSGASTHTLKNAAMLGGGQRNDGRSDSSRHEITHGNGGGVSDGHFFGGGNSGAHAGVCHRGGQGC